MADKDTVLVGCEILCLGFEGSDYVACPLHPDEQKVCRQRLQYEAGIREVVKIANKTIMRLSMGREVPEWQTFKKDWGIKDG